jgi:hypothetical protein
MVEFQMFAELQMLTPMVATREVYFVRYCKQLSAEQWAIVDVSVDKVENNIDASLVKCRKRPSGCIIEDKSNGHCKVYNIYIYTILLLIRYIYLIISTLDGVNNIDCLSRRSGDLGRTLGMPEKHSSYHVPHSY